MTFFYSYQYSWTWICFGSSLLIQLFRVIIHYFSTQPKLSPPHARCILGKSPSNVSVQGTILAECWNNAANDDLYILDFSPSLSSNVAIALARILTQAVLVHEWHSSAQLHSIFDTYKLQVVAHVHDPVTKQNCANCKLWRITDHSERLIGIRNE